MGVMCVTQIVFKVFYTSTLLEIKDIGMWKRRSYYAQLNATAQAKRVIINKSFCLFSLTVSDSGSYDVM